MIFIHVSIPCNFCIPLFCFDWTFVGKKVNFGVLTDFRITTTSKENILIILIANQFLLSKTVSSLSKIGSPQVQSG